LRASIRYLVEDVGIPGYFVLNAIERWRPVESQMERFENRVSRVWYQIHRKPRAKPAQTSRLWKRGLQPWEEMAHPGIEWRSTDPSKQPAKPPAAPLRPGKRAEAFLLCELAGEREAPAVEVERRAVKQGIPLRTLDRARRRLSVVSRRRGDRFWLSLPRTSKSA
jgi:hypothetical protein